MNRGEVLGIDEFADVALLDLSPNDFDWSGTERRNGLEYLNRWGKGIKTSTSIRLGSEVLAVGFPEGGGGRTVTNGVVSAEKVYVDGIKWIKTDTALNPGNSGGPLMTMSGQIIDMNSWGRADLENVGYALHMEEIFARFDELKHGGMRVAATSTPAPTPIPLGHFTDGSFLAVLTWDGGWYNTKGEDEICVDRVWESNTYYSWRTECPFTGREQNGFVYAWYRGQWLEAQWIELEERPY